MRTATDSLTWTPWQPLLTAFTDPAIPRTLGLYRNQVNRPHRRRLHWRDRQAARGASCHASLENDLIAAY